VNTSIDRTNLITLEQMPEIYEKPINFNVHLDFVGHQMYQAVRLNVCTRDDVVKTIRFLSEMKQFYGFF
jgi:hypothetical protein